MRRRARHTAGLLLALAFAGAVAAQGPLPQPDGWVTDLAGFLTAQEERSLEALMESYKQGSDNEIALVTVPNLDGRSLEQYALEVGRAWGIGEKERNNGALLFVAKQERKVRIEVGRGLEGTLTDSISGRIIRDVIAPDFKRGRFYEGLRAGIETMHAAAGGDYAKIPARSRQRPRTSGKSSGGACVLPLIFFLILLFNIIGRGRRGGRGGRGGGLLPWLILGAMTSSGRRSSGWHGGSSGGFGGGGFGGFGGGGGFSGGGASGGW